MKTFLPLAFACLLLAACNKGDSGTGPVIANDGFEPDSGRASATVFPVDTAAQNHVLTPGDKDWYAFAAVAGKTYTVTTLGPTDTYLELYRPDGTSLIAADDNSGAAGNASLAWDCDTSGTYYFRVRGADAGVTGRYSVVVASSVSSSLPDAYEPDDTYLLANKIRDSYATGHTLSPNDQDWFSFKADSGAAYVLSTSGAADTRMELYGRTGTGLIAQNDDGGSGGSSQIEWKCDTSGTYYVDILGSTGKKTGEYELSVYAYTPVAADTFENDDRRDLATPIAVDGFFQSHTLTPGDQDWYSFVADTGVIYTFATAGETDAYLELYDSTGTVLLGSNDDGQGDDAGNARLTWISHVSGKRYFKVRGYSAKDEGSYLVSVTSAFLPDPDAYEPDNSRPQARAITVDSAAQAHTLTVGDQDWFSFRADSGAEYFLGTDGSIPVAVSLYDTTGTAVLSQTPAVASAALDWTCPATGTYYFKVRGADSVTLGNYGAYVSAVYSNGSDAYEPDDTYLLSKAIAVNGASQNHTLSYADADWLNFQATAGVTYTLKTTGNSDTYLTLYNSGLSDLAENDQSGGNDNALISWTCPASGKYYLEVTGWEDESTGPYGVVVTSSP